MKRLLIVIVLLAAIGGGAFLYMTRPVSAPSNNPVSTQEQGISDNEVVEQGSAAAQLFVIDATRSEAKFEINEVLAGEPFHVVGITKDVSGKISVNPFNSNLTDVGSITINARTLKTDSERRNGAIGRMILKSEAHEFITFTPKSLSGLYLAPVLGTEYTFDVTGTLTVAGTTKEVTFSVKAKANSENEIQGIATASINYPDFGLVIPKVPMVASVEEKVDLTFSFVAVKK